MTSLDFKQARTIINLCINLGKTPTRTMQMLEDAKQTPYISGSMIFKWHKLFGYEKDSVNNDAGRGRKSVINAALVTSVKNLMEGDRRLTVQDVA